MSPSLQRMSGLVLAVAAASSNAQGIRQDQSHSYGNLVRPDLEDINIPLDNAGFDDGWNLWVESPSEDGEPRRASGSDLKGVTLRAAHNGMSVRYKISEVRPHEHEGSHGRLWEYKVKFALPSGKFAWLCRDRDSSGGDYAFAVPYALSKSGAVREDTENKFFRFACVAHSDGERLTGGGAIAKCVEWGFPPWPQPGMPGRGTKLEALRFYGSCLFMAMADYCGEGLSNTFPGTRIGFADSTTDFGNLSQDRGWRFSELQKEPGPERGDSRLEGFWNAQGALCIGDRRWSTFSTEGTCVRNLPECATRPAQHWIDQGALFVSYATFIDSMLVTFLKGGRSLTTSRVERPGKEPLADQYRLVCDRELAAQLQEAGLDCDKWKQASIEGPITASKVKANDQALYRYALPNGTMVTTTREGYRALAKRLPELPEDPGAGVVEGYVHAAEGEIDSCKERGTKPLRLILDKSGAVRTTSKRPHGSSSEHIMTLGCIQSVGRPDYLQPAHKPSAPPPGNGRFEANADPGRTEPK